MKKLLPIFFAALLLVAACKKTENQATPTPATENNTGADTTKPKDIVVAEVNSSLINKVTGSQCPPCGSWGWEAFESLIATNKSNTFFMGTYSDNYVAKLFITPEAEAMENNWGVTGFPTFAANGVAMLDRTNTGVNSESEVAKANAAVAAHNSSVVNINTGFRTTIIGDSMIIETKTKFFQALNGDIFLAVYLIEDKVKGYQSGNPDGTEALHHFVLRGGAKLDGAATTEVWGYPIGLGGSNYTPAGTTYTNRFAINIKGYNKDNLSVGVVQWRKIGIRYKYLNGSSNQIK